MIRKLHPVAAPLAPAAAAAATARTPAAEGAAPPAGHGAHPLTVTLPHAHAPVPVPVPALIRAARAVHAAATGTFLLLATTVRALAPTAVLPRFPLIADATIAAVLLHLPTATPDAPGVLHPDPALAAVLRSTGGEVGLWGGTGAVSPAHPGT